MQRLKLAKAAALVAGLAMVAAACGGGGGTTSGGGASQGNGTKGGTLRVVNNSDVDYLDTADAYSTLGFTLERAYARTLYSFDITKGAEDFGSGKAKDISGMVASGNSLTVNLVKPAADFLSIVALPFFAPVPKEAERYKGGADYSKHVIGSGPYTLKTYE